MLICLLFFFGIRQFGHVYDEKEIRFPFYTTSVKIRLNFNLDAKYAFVLVNALTDMLMQVKGGTDMFNVLLVDDEPWVLEGLRTMIAWEKHGFRVCGEASSGRDALRMVQDYRPELVVTDIRMPMLNGLEFMEQSNRMLEKPPKFVVLSGYDDFEYARTAMRQRAAGYLLKPVDEEEMDALLAILSRKIKGEAAAEDRYARRQQLAINHMINRLLHGEYREDLMAQACRLLNIQGRERICCLLIESAFGFDEMLRVVKELCTKGEGVCFQDGSGRNGILLIGTDNRPMDGHPEEPVQGIYRRITELTGSPATVCVSQQSEGIRSFREAYVQAAEISQIKQAQGKSGLFFYCGNVFADKRRQLQSDRFKPLLDKVRSQSPEEISANVKEIFSCFAADVLDIENIKAQVADLELSLCRSVQEMRGQPDACLENFSEGYGSLGEIHDFSRLQTYVEGMCLQAAGVLRELERQNEGNTIFHVIQYVDREYRNKLQLQDLAKQFHLNSTYLGQLFKKNTGKPFNEYINDKRIEEAKRLLKRSSMKIAEVAVQVGFPNTDYFIAKFKLKTGTLPSVFQKEAGSSAGKEGEEPSC